MTDDHFSLKPGTVVGYYSIVRILGAGGFGITYLAQDIKFGKYVVIKEYFPNVLAIRNFDNSIIAKTNSDQDFSRGRERFKEEAQILAKFNHHSIVKILGYFEVNNTAYFVMAYEEGHDLTDYLKQEGSGISQNDILSIIMPILEALKEVHLHNFLHRDIKPSNILLRVNSSPVLIDFGASKMLISDSSSAVTSMLTEGYAPLEQYSTDPKHQGSFTDIYAVGAVMYRMITGDVPPSAQTRSYQVLQNGNDPIIKLLNYGFEDYDKNFLLAIDTALNIKAKDRPQNIQDFQALLMNVKTDTIKEDTHKQIERQAFIEPKVVAESIWSFEGRINRSTFFGYSILAFILQIVGFVSLGIFGSLGAIVIFITTMAALWIIFASIIKRAKDMGHSGIPYVILTFIPYINFIVYILLLFIPGRLDQRNIYNN
jgi:serine/threonine protein kinase